MRTFANLGLTALIAIFGNGCARGLHRSAVPYAQVNAHRLEIRLPYSDITKLGCAGRADSMRAGDVRLRTYFWSITHDFADGRASLNHWMDITLSARAPSPIPLAATELNTAFRMVPAAVVESRGEPPREMQSTPATRGSIQFGEGMLRIRVEGTEAVAAFLRASTDQLRVAWCETPLPASIGLRLRHQ